MRENGHLIQILAALHLGIGQFAVEQRHRFGQCAVEVGGEGFVSRMLLVDDDLLTLVFEVHEH